jgi:hypothetical protein
MPGELGLVQNSGVHCEIRRFLAFAEKAGMHLHFNWGLRASRGDLRSNKGTRMHVRSSGAVRGQDR